VKTRNPIRPVTVVPESTAYLPHLLALLLLWVLSLAVGLHSDAVKAEEARADSVALLVSCMNGTARWVDAEGIEVGCMPAQYQKVRK
jgi:hypothetical protein